MPVKYLDERGAFRLRTLFVDWANTDYTPVYTYKREDVKGYPSLYKLYLKYCEKDPTEYTFVQATIGDWEHWKALSKCSWFAPELASWREEIQILLKSKTWDRMLAIANNKESTKQEQLTALKWLAINAVSQSDKKKAKRGAPSSEEIEGALKEELRIHQDHKDDLIRLGLN